MICFLFWMIVFSSVHVLRQIAVKSMSNYAYTPHSAPPSNSDKSHCMRQICVFTGLCRMIYKIINLGTNSPEELNNEIFSFAKHRYFESFGHFTNSSTGAT